MNLQNVDISDIWFPAGGVPNDIRNDKQVEFYRKVAEDLGIPPIVDLITCNPPWLPMSLLQPGGSGPGEILHSLDTDNAVYDPKERFLISSFNFAKFHLAHLDEALSPEMLLIYSDYAENLGVQAPNRIPTLAREFGFTQVDLLDRTRMPDSKRNRKQDPLKLIKRQSFIQLWRIAR